MCMKKRSCSLMIWNMGRFNFLWLLLLPAFAAAAEHPDSLFAKGNRLYAAGDYEGAATCYEALVTDGYQEAAVYYNLGNTHFKLNNLAPSILYYEKAQKLDPTDPDIRKNLAFVNLGITDRIQPLPEFFIDSWWRGLLFSASLTTWSVIALICWLGAFVLLIGYLYALRPRVKRAAFYSGVATMALALLLLVVAYSQRRMQVGHDGAVVFSGQATVRSAPSESEKTLFVIHEGTKVQIVEQVNDWLRVSLPNGHEGWIKSEAVKLI